MSTLACLLFFFFNDTATTEIYTLSLHDALPISLTGRLCGGRALNPCAFAFRTTVRLPAQLPGRGRSEEHTSELQSQSNLVCRLLLEKKKPPPPPPRSNPSCCPVPAPRPRPPAYS